MSDHDFEKQVRQKLNNLKLTPTAEGWENIENRLRERRQRRTPFIWLPLLLAGTLAGGYFIIKGDNTTKTNSVIVAQRTGVKANKNAPNTSNKPFAERDNPVEKKTTEGKTLRQLPDHSLLLSKNNLKRSSAVKNRKNPLEQALQPSLSAQNEPARSAPIEPAIADRMDPPTRLEEGRASVESPRAALTLQSLPPEAKAVTPAKTASDEHATAAIHSNPSIKKSSNSKWSYAVKGYGGIVAVNEGGLLNFNHPNVEDVAYTAQFAGARPNYAPQYKPSTISPGLAFSAGAEVKRVLSHRFSVSAGLNYTQLNTRSTVGERVNSSQVVNNGTRGYLFVQSYYLLDPNENRQYRNRYHFIEVPVTLNTRINKSEKLPIYWNAGLLVSRLLSSSSLHFDGTTGVYYKNDRLLNQTQAGVTTGFSFVLLNKTAHPLWIGPVARSNISTILKKDIPASKHFVTLGLDVKLFLKK